MVRSSISAFIATIGLVTGLSAQSPHNARPTDSQVWIGAGAGAQALPDATSTPLQLEFTLTARSGRHLGIPVTIMTVGGPAAFYIAADYHAEPVGEPGGFLGGGLAHIMGGSRGVTGIFAEAGLDLPVRRNTLQSYV